MHSWDDLRYLLALKENRNLINAAKSLKTNPTTVSRRIKRLSDETKQSLISRKLNGEWVLTQEGEALAKVARRCQEEIHAFDSKSAAIGSKKIKISTTEFISGLYLNHKIGNFLQTAPEISLTLDLCDRNVSLAFGEADLAIRMGRPQSGRLVASKIGDIDMNVFSPMGQDIQQWVGLPSEFDTVPEMRLGLEHFGEPPTVRLGSFSCIRRFASENGFGCVGPTKMMDGWTTLRKVKSNDVKALREVWSIFHESRRRDQSLQIVRDWVKGCFQSASQDIAA